MIDVANYVAQNLGPVDLASLLTTGNRIQDAQQNTLLNKLKLKAAQEQMQRQSALPQILANIVGSKGTPGQEIPQYISSTGQPQMAGGSPGTGLLGGQISPQEAIMKMASSDPTLLPHAFQALATMYKPQNVNNDFLELVQARNDLQQKYDGTPEANPVKPLMKRSLEDINKKIQAGGQGNNPYYGGIQTMLGPNGQVVNVVYDKQGNPQVLSAPSGLSPTVGMNTQPGIGPQGPGLYSTPTRGIPGGVPVTTAIPGLKPMPSEGELNKAAQEGLGVEQLNKMKSYVDSGKIDVGPIAGRALIAKAKIPGMPLSKEEGDMLSLTEQLSNMILQAYRGAQVGPAEQERFNLQLPRLEQNKSLFLANVDNTIKNLTYLNNLASKNRSVPNLTNNNNGTLSIRDQADAILRGNNGNRR